MASGSAPAIRTGGATSAKIDVRFAWSVVGFLWLVLLLNYVDRQLVFSLFPVLRSELGFSDTQLGLTGSLFIWTYSLCMAPSGRLADLVRREHLIIASLVLWSLATLGTGLSHSVGAILLFRIAMGITESLYMPAALGLIGVLHGRSSRSTALAIHSTAQLLGIVLGGWYGGWAADHWGWRWGFAVLAVAGIMYAVVLVPVFRRIPTLQPESRKSTSGPAEVFRSRCYVALTLGFVAFGIMLWMLYAWLPSFIYDKYHLSLAESGLTATLYLQLSSAAGLIAGGVAADRLVKRIPAARLYLVATGLLGCTPFAYLTLAVHSLLVLKLCAAGFGFFAGLLISNTFAAAYDVVSKRNYGFASGMLNFFPGLVSGTALLVAGMLKQSNGMVSVISWGAFASLAMALLLIFTTWRHFESEHHKAER